MRRMTRDEELQRRATAPDASVWVGANAGSGKTHVLASRVTRLLLAGTRPSAMLCLTFTKAAAAEMSNRVYGELAKWTVSDDATLRRTLAERGEKAIDAALLGRARALFAHTLDAPGGLKIQTIHAFCESLLKRFPLEAGVPPYFSVADEAAAAELLAEARDRLVREAVDDPGLREALALVATASTEGGFGALMAEAVARRRRLQLLAARYPGGDAAAVAIAAALGVAPGTDDDALLHAFLAATPRGALRRAAAALARGSAKDVERGLLVAQLADADEAMAIELLWHPVFLTSAGEPRVGLGTKSVDAGAVATLRAEQQRLIAFREQYDAARLARASGAFLLLGQRLLALYARAKAERAVLDYDDLILRARELLAAPDAAPWVLYKLDGGLDHILVDEAQDTAAEQWEVIVALAAEFFAGVGGRSGTRTVFAVGDPKQSIFGFQGAEPALFDAQRAKFRRQVRQAGQRWEDTPLETSRRSVPAILGFVDALFAHGAARPGVVAPGEVLRHETTRVEKAGFVELWPLIQAAEDTPAAPWDAPLDYTPEKSPPLILADRIAETIKRWLNRGEALESDGAPIKPNDILILVRRRDAFFQAIVRALKKLQIPVAGVDRLVLAEEIAVMDLVALGRFALLPQDDLTLATVLKGPLFGFSEEELFELAHGRAGRLWYALRERAEERPQWREAAHALRAILARVDRVSPYDFFAGILSARGGRARILARLGPEAAEPLDEFLAQALAFERTQPPALENFLHWFAAAGAEIKRDPEPARAEVRVMTVHGAKGLQANIVILPDTCAPPNGSGIESPVAWTEGALPSGGLPLWPGAGGRDHPLARDARQAQRAAEADEHRRLLYVAATRARDRLYVCGWFNKRKPAGCWYDLVAETFDGLRGTVDVALPWGERGRRFLSGAPVARQPARDEGPAAAAALPAWARAPAPVEPLPPRPLAPSRPASEPPVSSPLSDAQRFRRGRLIHRLLQALPDVAADRRPAVAARMLASETLDEATRAEIVASALAVLRDPAVAAAFGPGSLAEAPVVGRIASQVIAGQVDRLVVGPSEVLVIDYKTNRPPPKRAEEVAPVYLGQMAAYRALLREIYPGRTVRCLLLWTEGPRLMPLADRLLDRHAPKPLI
jgi:ATP-dependent helicase/nuclease subunit A